MRLEINYRKKNCEKHKHGEAKQFATKQPMDHQRNQRGNKKLPTDKWKQNLWGAAKEVLREKLIAIQSYLRKQEKSQINNINLHLNQTEKKRTNKTHSRRKETIKTSG